jgi:transcriptional regulator with XRE-family HTH domain
VPLLLKRKKGNSTMSALGRDLKRARKAKGLTQADVAEALGITVQAISQWETGKTDPTRFNLMALNDLLAFEIDPKALKLDYTTRMDDEERPKLVAPLVPWQNPERWHRFDRDAIEEDWTDFTDTAETNYEVKWDAVGDVYALILRGREAIAPFNPNDVIIIDTGRAPEKNDFVVAEAEAIVGAAFLAIYRPLGVDENRVPVFDLERPKNGSTISIDAKHPGRVIGTVREHRRYFRTS